MSLSILITPDNNKKNFKRCLYHVSRFTKTLLDKNENFEVIVVDDGTCDINEEINCFEVNFFWKSIRPHYNSITKCGFDKLYNFHIYSEKIGFDNCSFEKILKISGSTIPIQNTLTTLYESNILNAWNLIDVYGIDPILENGIDLYGIFFPKNTIELSKTNLIQSENYLKYQRPIFGITKKDFYWSDNYNYISNCYALCSIDCFLNNEKLINEDKMLTLKENIEIFSNIYDNK